MLCYRDVVRCFMSSQFMQKSLSGNIDPFSIETFLIRFCFLFFFCFVFSQCRAKTVNNVPRDGKTSQEAKRLRAIISFTLSGSDSSNTRRHTHTHTREQRHRSKNSRLVSTSQKLGKEQSADKYRAGWLIMLTACTVECVCVCC